MSKDKVYSDEEIRSRLRSVIDNTLGLLLPKFETRGSPVDPTDDNEVNRHVARRMDSILRAHSISKYIQDQQTVDSNDAQTGVRYTPSEIIQINSVGIVMGGSLHPVLKTRMPHVRWADRESNRVAFEVYVAQRAIVALLDICINIEPGAAFSQPSFYAAVRPVAKFRHAARIENNFLLTEQAQFIQNQLPNRDKKYLFEQLDNSDVTVKIKQHAETRRALLLMKIFEPDLVQSYRTQESDYHHVFSNYLDWPPIPNRLRELIRHAHEEVIPKNAVTLSNWGRKLAAPSTLETESPMNLRKVPRNTKKARRTKS